MSFPLLSTYTTQLQMGLSEFLCYFPETHLRPILGGCDQIKLYWIKLNGISQRIACKAIIAKVPSQHRRKFNNQKFNQHATSSSPSAKLSNWS
jgi:hypothetical protein